NYNDMWRYDAANDQWSAAPGSPLLGGAWSSTFVVGNNAYAGLGAKFQGTGLTGNLNFYKFVMDEVTTGIGESSEDAIDIYPNPASGFLTIHTASNEAVQVEVYSTLGQNVISKKVNDLEKISLEGLSSGMYYVKIISGNKTIAGRKVQIIR
ncbi:MAG: hypothetical protein JWO03_2757, partial [Bacteroidetes bacterium]|nr:hypothetical protein [Bacteroidota bacterium]